MTAEDLLRALADGAPHSGEELAQSFGLTRAAVWKRIATLRDWGIDVSAVPGRGYCLSSSIELLDQDLLEQDIARTTEFDLDRFELFTELASTNRHLLEKPPSRVKALTACVAEYQRAGRGRRGRSWNTPLGAGLCLSVGWRYAETPDRLAALTLAAGVVVRRVIARTANVEIGLKWPNDLVHDGRKLGGILVELSAESHGQCHVVVGLGLNLQVPAALLSALSDWPRGAIDLSRIQQNGCVSRHELCAALLRELGILLAEYPSAGFGSYIDDWREADQLCGQRVEIRDADGVAVGTARGIDDDAALIIEPEPGRIRRVISGDVTVRGAT